MEKKKIYYLCGIIVAGLIAAQLVSAKASPKTSPVDAKEISREAPAQEITNYDNWRLTCGKENKNGQKQCRVFQRSSKDDKAALVVIFMVAHEKDKTIPVMRIVTPLGVNLASKLSFGIDDNKPIAIPYKTCEPSGCTVLVTGSDDFISKIKNGKTMHFAYQGAQGNAKPFKIDVTTKGFANAYEALLKNSTK